MSELVRIDGARGEGGGQLLRSALALSLVTGRPFHITGIRARRPNPGLAPQHLHAVRAFREIGGGSCRGDQAGSTELFFEPAPVRPGSYRVDIETAGSVTLVLQAVALPLALASQASEVILRGGTHVPWSPPFNFIESCWLPFMGELGLSLKAQLNRAGFYPPGGGEIVAWIGPGARLRPLELVERGSLQAIEIISASAGLPGHVRQRQAARARTGVQSAGLSPSVQLVELSASSPGSVVAITGRFERTRVTTSAIGARGKPAEAVGEEAASAFRFYLARSGALDDRMADQILLPLSLAPGRSVVSTVRVSEHLRTNLEVIRAFLDRAIEVDGAVGATGKVTIL